MRDVGLGIEQLPSLTMLTYKEQIYQLETAHNIPRVTSRQHPTHPEDFEPGNIEDSHEGSSLELVPAQNLVNLLGDPLERPLVNSFSDTLAREPYLVLVLCLHHVLSTDFYPGFQQGFLKVDSWHAQQLADLLRH